MQKNDRLVRAVEITAEKIKKGEMINKREIALEAGYSPLVAKSPGENVFNRVTFQAMLREKLPMKMLMDKHKAMLECGNDKVEAIILKLGYSLYGVLDQEKRVEHQHSGELSVSWGEQPKMLDINAQQVQNGDFSPFDSA